MMSFKSIAHPYAKAIYEFSIDHRSLDIWKNMLEHMVNMSNHKEIKKIILSMSFFQQLADFFISICGDKINKYGRNFIKILVHNRRLILLEDIYEEFILLYNNYKNIICIKVVSAYPLQKKQISYIRKILKERFLKNINIICEINKNLIDGLIIKFNDIVIDLSVQYQLKNLLHFLQY
ncbi:MAG: ATP synthase F1 subunit delta [Buchnera aphidicola (Schlechtendalia peitan)]